MSKTKGHQDYNNVIREYLHETIPAIFQEKMGLRPGGHFGPVSEDKAHRTLARDPDFFKMWMDKKNRPCELVHLEIHVKDEVNIAWRCLEFDCIKAVQHRLPIHTAVIFIGSGKSKRIPASLKIGAISYELVVINIHELPIEAFLKSTNPAEVLWGILADYGEKSVEEVLPALIDRLFELTFSTGDSGYFASQLEILSHLRNLQAETAQYINTMPLDFFDIKKDIRFNQGIEQGIETRNHLFVLNLLLSEKHSDDEIASLADVSLDFVRQVRAEIFAEKTARNGKSSKN